MGDIHFSQGDGEISFCGAILDISIFMELIKGGMAKYGMVNPMFKTSPVEPHYSDYLTLKVFQSMSRRQAVLHGCTHRLSSSLPQCN